MLCLKLPQSDQVYDTNQFASWLAIPSFKTLSVLESTEILAVDHS